MKKQRGYIALIVMLFFVAVGGAIATSLILLGVGASRTSFALDQSYQAKALANACAEEALQKLRESAAFTGSATISLGNGSCTYTVTVAGQNRVITATGTIGSIIRKIRIRLSINPITLKFTISSWQEVADF